MKMLELLGTDWVQSRNSGSGPRDATGRWLLELERAQWALQGRHRGAASQAPSRGRETQEAATAPVFAKPGASAAGPAAGRSLPDSSEPSRGSFGASSGADIEAAQGEPTSGRVTGSAEGRSAPADPARGSRPVTRPYAAPRPLHPVSWSRLNVHAFRSGEALDLWIRDASLDETDRQRLAAELRAGLGKTGVRLGTLFINGEAIVHEIPGDNEQPG